MAVNSFYVKKEKKKEHNRNTCKKISKSKVCLHIFQKLGKMFLGYDGHQQSNKYRFGLSVRTLYCDDMSYGVLIFTQGLTIFLHSSDPRIYYFCVNYYF